MKYINKKRIFSFLWKIKAWILGYDVCYRSPSYPDRKASTAFCKRRRGHLGKCSTGSGYKFNGKKN